MLTAESSRDPINQDLDSVGGEQILADVPPDLDLLTAAEVVPVVKIRSAESERNAKRRKRRDERIKTLKNSRKRKH